MGSRWRFRDCAAGRRRQILPLLLLLLTWSNKIFSHSLLNLAILYLDLAPGISSYPARAIMLTKFETKSPRVKGLAFHPKRPWILARSVLSSDGSSSLAFTA